jgi:hypothetical protein
MRAFFAILIALLAGPLPAQAKQTQRYVADYEAKWPVPLLPAPDTAARSSSPSTHPCSRGV